MLSSGARNSTIFYQGEIYLCFNEGIAIVPIARKTHASSGNKWMSLAANIQKCAPLSYQEQKINK